MYPPKFFYVINIVILFPKRFFLVNLSHGFIARHFFQVRVETLVQLSYKKPDTHLEVALDFENEGLEQSFADVETRVKSGERAKVDYKAIQDYIEEKYGFKVHMAYIAEVKRELGLPIYDAPNAVEELKKPRQPPTEKMVEAIKDTLKYFEII